MYNNYRKNRYEETGLNKISNKDIIAQYFSNMAKKKSDVYWVNVAMKIIKMKKLI